MRRNKKHQIITDIPSPETIEKELFRVRFQSRYKKVLLSTIYALIITAAVSVLIATLFLPVLQIYGASMSPTLTEGDIVVSIKKSNYETGDIIALYYSNKVLVKRAIAFEFDIVDIDSEGNISVNGKVLEENYISEKAYGEATNIEFPYQVPEKTIFVVGDSRETSVDSRNSTIGCISTDEIVGKIVFVVWPLSNFGALKGN